MMNEVEEYYRSFWAGKESPLHRNNDEQTYRAYAQELNNIFSLYGYTSGEVLEVGCGNGGLFPYFNFEESQYTGIDISPSLLELFKSKHPKINVSNVNLLAHLGVASPTTSTDVQASALQAFANQTIALVDGEGNITAVGGDPALTTIERVTEGFDLTGGLLDVLDPELTPVGPTPAPETDDDG